MTDTTQRFDRSKRQAFRKMLGLGSGTRDFGGAEAQPFRLLEEIWSGSK